MSVIPPPDKLRVTPDAIEEAAKLLYIRALKILPDDIKAGFHRLPRSFCPVDPTLIGLIADDGQTPA